MSPYRSLSFLLLYLLYYKDEDFAFLHKNAKKEESDG